MPETAANGITSIASNHTVDGTVARLEAILAEKGAKVFALIDHSGEAANAGFNMRDTKLLIFGSPKAGTPLMLASPTTALDLPLKVLVWEDPDGRVWLTYNSVEFLRQRHNFPPEFATNLAVIEALSAKAAE